jgi:hypothetical protein
MKKKQPKQLLGWLHIRVPDDLHKEIAELATIESRSVSSMIRVLLQEALLRRKGDAKK